MRVSRNSLLVRMVFYNDIAIIVASTTIALFLTFTAFQNIESKVIDSARDKISLMNRAYNGEILKVKDDFSGRCCTKQCSEENCFHSRKNYYLVPRKSGPK